MANQWHGYHYKGTKWTSVHIKWFRKLEVKGLYCETLDEYLATYEEQAAYLEPAPGKDSCAEQQRTNRHLLPAAGRGGGRNM